MEEKFKNHEGKHHDHPPPPKDGDDKKCNFIPSLAAGCIAGYIVRVSWKNEEKKGFETFTIIIISCNYPRIVQLAYGQEVSPSLSMLT